MTFTDLLQIPIDHSEDQVLTLAGVTWSDYERLAAEENSYNKLALPLARIKPSMLEILPPVTLDKILVMSGELLKKACPLLGTENSPKL